MTIKSIGVFAAVIFALLATSNCPAADLPSPNMHWPFESTEAIGFEGTTKLAPGAKGTCIAFDGASIVTVPNSSNLTAGKDGFTLAVWVNPYVVDDDQQMIAAKNRYSLNERQWGVMVDKDGRFRLYVWQGGWKTVAAAKRPTPGHWYQISVVTRPGKAELWVNGKRAGTVDLALPIPRTAAPLTFGAVNDNGRIWQNLVGALDDAQLFDRPLSENELAALYHPVNTMHDIPESVRRTSIAGDATWHQQIQHHTRQDRTTVVFDGVSPDKLACDTTLRLLPDGSWVMVMLGGGDKEPHPRNQVFLSRSLDAGTSWSELRPLDFGFPREGNTAAMVPSELMVHNKTCTLFFATHDGAFGGWREWLVVSDDSCHTWGRPIPAPGRLHDRTFIRNHIITRDGRILLPFQHYLDGPGPLNPRNGILMSDDGGKNWIEHGNIRISQNDKYRGWAENNIVELSDGRIAMLIRADGLGGVLYYAESIDGGRTWPKFATKSRIPNPGSKATLYALGGDTVALLHNPNPRHRSPLALWVSFDGLKTWPYQRVLVAESADGPSGRLNYPDGFVSADKHWLHFAFDDNRHRAVAVSARLPALPTEVPLWDDSVAVPNAADIPQLEGVEFEVIKKWEPDNDGYHWLHGVALAWHHNKLYASFGHNTGRENTVTEEARYCVSSDAGKTWSKVMTMDIGNEAPDLAVSHGVFLSHEDTLWAFLGAFHGTRKRVHTRAYTLDESTGHWQPHGVVAKGGFWPMAPPVKMDDGNWIMPGLQVGGENPAAVAISQGDDFTKWELAVIPRGNDVQSMWGESALVVDGPRVVNIARYGKAAQALVALSNDYGRSWTPSVPSNLPMARSKPYAGTLSTGQRYLICTTTADTGSRRAPLTIAISQPGQNTFSRLFVIRPAVFEQGPGETNPKVSLAYPYAIEHEGKLYVAYSNNGGRGANRNSAELAIIPLASLQVGQ